MPRLRGGAPRLDANEVLRFFEARAAGADPRDHYAVTVFTDRETAEQRHLAERDMAFSLLDLPDARAHVLDIGCGGGRWAASLAEGEGVAGYLGIDFSRALIHLARAQKLPPAYRFEVLPVAEFAAGAALPRASYSHVLIVAVAIYMNDDEVEAMLRRAAALLAPQGRLYLREGVTTGTERLTLIEEPSDALQDRYSVVYRTPAEHARLIAACGLTVVASDALDNAHFARHGDTRHQYFLCART